MVILCKNWIPNVCTVSHSVRADIAAFPIALIIIKNARIWNAFSCSYVWNRQQKMETMLIKLCFHFAPRVAHKSFSIFRLIQSMKLCTIHNRPYFMEGWDKILRKDWVRLCNVTHPYKLKTNWWQVWIIDEISYHFGYKLVCTNRRYKSKILDQMTQGSFQTISAVWCPLLPQVSCIPYSSFKSNLHYNLEIHHNCIRPISRRFVIIDLHMAFFSTNSYSMNATYSFNLTGRRATLKCRGDAWETGPNFWVSDRVLHFAEHISLLSCAALSIFVLSVCFCHGRFMRRLKRLVNKLFLLGAGC